MTRDELIEKWTSFIPSERREEFEDDLIAIQGEAVDDWIMDAAEYE